MKKALIVATTASMIDQFNMPNIQILQKLEYEVSVACNFTEGNTTSVGRVEEFKSELDHLNVRRYEIIFPRSPYELKKLRSAYKELKKLILIEKYDLIHCHTPVGGVLTRIVGAKARQQFDVKIMYTAHGFHFYKGAPLKNWLFYFPIEWICSFWTDVLITINREDYKRAKKYLKAKRVEYIPGVGIDLKRFCSYRGKRSLKREQLGVHDDEYMMLSVGELIKQKNVSIVIRALKQINNSKIKFFICGIGELESEIKSLIKIYGLENKVFLLGYRKDISELCQAADLFVFPSLQEGLPVTLMEAIACKTPVICSDIRENRELITDNELLFQPQDEASVETCINKALHCSMEDIVEKNYKRLMEYDLEKVVNQLVVEYADIESYEGILILYARKKLLQNLRISSKAVLLLSVGELNQNKNLEIVIRAIAKLNNMNVHYIIAGQGKLKEYLVELSDKLDVREQVHLLGFRRDVEYLYQCADVYVLPSLREGLNVSVMEAMASGLPVICSRIRGNIDLVENGKGGILCDCAEVMDYVSAIKRLIKDEKCRNNMGSYNKGVILRYGIEAVMERTLQIYKECLQEKN